MSYEKPNTQFQVYRPSNVQGQQDEKDQQREQQRRANTARNLQTLFSAGEQVVGSLLQRKLGLDAFSVASIERSNKLNDQVAQFGTPYDDFNDKSQYFFAELIGNFNEIQTALDKGEHTNPELARRDLARIEQMVDQYESGISNIMATSSIIDNAMKVYRQKGAGAANTLSVTGAWAPQLNIIDKVRRGGALADDILITHDGTNIILEDHSITYKPGTEMYKKYGAHPVLNMAEFDKALTNKDNPYIKLVQDVSPDLTNAYDSFMKNKRGTAYNDVFTIIEEETKKELEEKGIDLSTATRTLTAEKELELKSALSGIPVKIGGKDYVVGGETVLTGGMYEQLIFQDGESIWEDMMPTSITGGVSTSLAANGEYPLTPPPRGSAAYGEYYTNYYKPMVNYLVERTIDENAIDLVRVSQMEKFNDDGTPKDGYDDQGNTVLEDNRGASRLSEKIITSNNFDEDLELIKSAKSGQTIVLSDGRKFKKN